MLPQGSSFTTRPQLAGTFGMIASTHWLATASGMAVLEAGGTAFDAAVAAGLVLQVVEPHMNGLGGEVPIIGYDAGTIDPSSTGVFVLDGRTRAGPRHAGRVRRPGPRPGPRQRPAPACVPAAFGTWMLLLGRHGRMRLRDVMQYAIGYARDGYPMTAGVSAGIAAAEPVFREYWPSSAEVYLAGGVPATGSRFANPDLAATYQRILDEAEAGGAGRDVQIEAARRAFYEGFVADAAGAYLAAAEVMDVTGERHRALLSPADLAGWRASAEEPVTLDFAGLTVCRRDRGARARSSCSSWPCSTGSAWRGWTRQARISSTPWSRARNWLLPTARPGTAIRGSLPSRSMTCCHSLTQRNAGPWSAPQHPRICVRVLLAAPSRGCPGTPPGRSASRAGWPRRSRPRRSPGPRPARPGRSPARAPVRTRAEPGGHLPPGRRGPVREHGVGHAERGWLQSSPVIPGLGFCLGTRAQMFTLTPGLPNSLAPGKRPRTTLTPSLALRGGEPYLAFGTPGGDQQDQWTLAFFLRHVLFGMNLQEAIDAPAFHTRHFPSSFYPRDRRRWRSTLRSAPGPRCWPSCAAGAPVTVRPPWSLGRVSAVARDGGMLYAAANPRGMQGYAAGR